MIYRLRSLLISCLFFVGCVNENTLPKGYLAASIQPQLKPIREERQIRKSEKEIFLDSLDAASNRLETPNSWLRIICYKESENDESAKNRHSSATGIIQFTSATAHNLGTSTAKIRRMSRVQQVPYAEAYFQKGIKKGGKYESLTDMYLQCLLPSKRKHHNEPNYVLMRVGDGYYGGNSGLDYNRDGVVQVWEVTHRLK